MKKLLLLLTLTIFLLTSSLAQNFGWVDYRSKIPKFPYDTVVFGNDTALAMFSDVFFINDYEGWVTVDCFLGNNDSAIILHTIDGGENWDTQSVPSYCSTIWMVNKNTGYAGSYDGRIYKTTDGGENWLLHGRTLGLNMDVAFAPEEEIGYVMVDQSYYMFKIDPDTIVERILLTSPNFWISVTCPTEDEVWFVGGSSVLFYNGDTLEFSSAYPGGYHSCILFANSTLGWISNDVYAQGYYEPKDSWVALTTLEESSTDMCNIGEDNLWVTGYQGLLINTHNAKDFKRLDDGHAEVNVVWETPTHPLGDAAFLSIHASSVNNVFVVGQEKAIMKYTEISGIGDKIEALQFELYPNPAVSFCNLQLPPKAFAVSQQSANIEIYDLNGRKLLEKHIPAGNEVAELDVSGLKSGVYFCRLIMENKSVTKKLIIK